ncbi:shikimate dehydrogenase (plasmid) [Halorussus salilacus]|uniref:shikimate dehydrogenase n=1 Tax=Halorussus salilacus TaxID=2953750 RepID=UPI00209CCB3E|nr:shikimate dehydrogenase [Halorussus salilacus]USZ70129.1 shikimate dehydrogenase [Halorussus salilacus]
MIDNKVVTALLGDPVEHSVSPTLYGTFAEAIGIDDYQHLKVRVQSDVDGDLEKAIEGLRAFGLVGCNITLPFKQDTLELVDELDETVDKIGAVNTIQNEDHRLVGYNTDGVGALKSIEERSRKITSNDKVVILGAGGAARAVSSEVYERTTDLVLVNRTLERAERLVNDLESWGGNGAEPLELDDENLRAELVNADFVLNCTSVGMHPDTDATVVPPRVLDHVDEQRGGLDNMIFWDAIFNPLQTMFLEEAEKRNATTIDGLGMMIYQGTEAFELWTGETVPEEAIVEARDRMEEELLS